ncbi:MAG: NADH:flavin oxidoreductase [Candidatus Lokiarchaeota archaeon]|nr:NADH:flavin oxidoreductase [Candidatus Lokiarchaeota archaeon]
MSILFEPIKIGNTKIKNRIVRSATHIARNTEDGYVTNDKVKYFKKLAEGGAGLIIKGFTYVLPSGRAFPLMSAIHDDKYIPGLKRLVDIVHKYGNGCKIAIQLSHAGREIGPGGYKDTSPISASSVLDPTTKIKPKRMSKQEITEIVNAFAEAAGRSVEAGFDLIQLHGAHGYLINQFLSPHTNRRKDEYGGSIKNRCRFVSEIYKEIKNRINNKIPLIIKMNATDFLDYGITIDGAIRIAEIFGKIGFEALEISGGVWEAMKKFKKRAFPPEARRIGSDPLEHAFHRDHARLIKENVKIPVMVVGGIRIKSMAEKIIKNKDADMISMSRPFICEPDLPNKWKNGISSISKCKSCNKCADDAINSVFNGEKYLGIRCIRKEREQKRKKRK